MYRKVSSPILLLRMFANARVIFYCHFPDLLLAKHDTFFRVLYRTPFDWLEEMATGMVCFSFPTFRRKHYSTLLRALF